MEMASNSHDDLDGFGISGHNIEDTQKGVKSLVARDQTTEQLPVDKLAEDVDGVRRSQREPKPTAVSVQYREDIAKQKKKEFEKAYVSFKQNLVGVRDYIKIDRSEEELWNCKQEVEKGYTRVEAAYEHIRSGAAVKDLSSFQRKVDTAWACHRDMVTHLNQRMSEKDVKEFDTVEEYAQLKLLKQPYAASVYSANTSVHQSEKSVQDQVVEAAVDLAASRVRFKALETQEHERQHLATLEADRCRIEEAVQAQIRKLERLKVQQEVEESDVKLRVLHSVAADDIHVVDPNVSDVNLVQSTLSPDAPVFSPCIDASAVNFANLPQTRQSCNNSAELSLATALANAMDRNRLPVPTPKVFSGNPIEFESFQRSFKTLIENKGISSEEKIYYLQQYVAGDARDAIAGQFFGSSESDYETAWETLKKRFGHPFKIQESFRNKLEDWPKVGPKDAAALQKYADFLKSCVDAMPHIKGLAILDDCKENQKMASKLPDWAINRWSRVVTESLDHTTEYPNFKRFAAFVEREARATCHPVISVAAVKTATSTQSRMQGERNKSARSLATDKTRLADKENMNAKDIKGERKRFCSFCKGEHYLSDCVKFADKGIDEKNKYLRDSRRCFGCLRIGHVAKQCKVRLTCQKCKGRHPTVMHDDSRSESKIVQQNLDQGNQSRAVSLNADNGESSTTNVVPVWVSSVSNPAVEQLVYALLDTQSDSTFIEARVCDELCASTSPVNLKLSTLLGKDVSVSCRRVEGLRIRGYTSAHYIDLPPTYTREFIPLDRSHIPTADTARGWHHLAHLASEMPPLLDCEVGLLIGYNCSAALAPRQVVTGQASHPYAIKTDLGWSVVGSLASVNSSDVTGFCHRVAVKEVPPATPRDVLRLLESDFQDTSHGEVCMSQEDIQFMQSLENSITTNAKGHLEMPLPFRARPNLPNNRILAEKRLCHLKKRLDGNPNYKEHYVQFMNGILRDGHAEVVNEAANSGELFYIPHHGVYHPKKPDKLRVVFDCPARYQGTSLNDHLLSGPDLTNNLFGVLCRFRRHPVAVMCDVEKMFHQFHVSAEDRDYLRFLWWENGDTSQEPVQCRMNVHLFGATSSPGCANFALRYLSRKFEEEYPLAAPFLRQNFYVDDGIASLESVEEARKLITEARELCSRGKLRLHKFIANDVTVIDSVPAAERAPTMQKIDLNKTDLPVERTLGMQWNTESDEFIFEVEEKCKPDTRRGILSIVASIYDPIGFISPFVLEGKSILQEMCKRGTSWDDPLPVDLVPRWERWKSDIQNLKDIHVPRCYKPVDFGPVLRTELHHFSDASSSGYGVCSYLRFVSDDQAHCVLVTSKSRVAPTKVVTIPRMELTAAVVAAKVSCKLKEELQMNIDDELFWCDSQIVLSYINSEAKRFHVFVANRVQFIREHTMVEQWQYVSTRNNPADYASRGLTAAELLTSKWLTGPDFLWTVDVVQKSSTEAALMLSDPEVKVQALNVSVESENHSDVLQRLCRYSDWNFLTRIVARIRRIAHSRPESRCLTVDEIDQAGLCVIRLAQQSSLRREWKVLEDGRQITSASKLHSLNPFIVDDVIRVGGRLRRSSLSFSQKHPIVLPKGHITELIIADCHRQVSHQGRGQTLNRIKAQGYWILGGSKMVADFIRRCVHCRRLRRPVEEQMMADLPEDRVESVPPFSFCGMDCFGPFITKNGRKECKRYGLMFTCLCSRAVHIEMIEDMSTDSFILGLRNFIAIRGTVTQIRSDQGSNFVGADNELKSSLQELDVDRITNFLSRKQCTFCFNAPSASHAGGVWERQIRTIRNVLNSTVALCDRVDDAMLRCLFYEAMLVVNSRPLTVVGSDPSDEPLTPNHLLTMKPTPLPVPGNFVKEDVYARKRWRRVQYLTEQFWSRWRQEYLQNLNERQKWNVPRRNVQVGDIVIIADVQVSRMQWPLAKIVEAVRDDDNLVRRVKAQLGTSCLDKCGRRLQQASILERPVQKIVVLLEATKCDD